MTNSDILFDLMVGARRRVISLYAMVLLIIVAISSQIKIPSPPTSEGLRNVVIWGTGCLLIVGLGFFWYRARAAATARLMALFRSGELRVQNVHFTQLLLVIIPFGWEVDVMLESGEHLAFGFWTQSPCLDLQTLLMKR